jgi:hypothetical protein
MTYVENIERIQPVNLIYETESTDQPKMSDDVNACAVFAVAITAFTVYVVLPPIPNPVP